MNILISLGLVLPFFALIALLVVLRNGRIPRRLCPGCGRKLGRAVAYGVTDYWERRYGAGVKVFDGPMRYQGARVVKCSGCPVESVFFAPTSTAGPGLP